MATGKIVRVTGMAWVMVKVDKTFEMPDYPDYDTFREKATDAALQFARVDMWDQVDPQITVEVLGDID